MPEGRRYTVQEAQAILLGLYPSEQPPLSVEVRPEDTQPDRPLARQPVFPSPNVKPSAPRTSPLSILNAPASGVADAMGVLMDTPGNLADAVPAAVRGAGRAVFQRPEEQNTPSRELASRGVQMPGPVGLAADIAADPLNLIPNPSTGVAAVAGAAGTPGILNRIRSVLTRAGAKLPAEAAQEAVTELPKQIRRVPGLGEVQDLAAGKTPVPVERTGVRSVQADTDAFKAFTERIALGSPDDRALVAEMFTKNQNFATARRMGQSNEQTAQLARDLVVELQGKPLPKGMALNAEQTVALNGAAEGAIERATELSKQVDAAKQAGQGVPQALIADQLEAAQEAVIAVQSMAGARSEAGRALQVYKEMRRDRAVMGDVAFIDKALKTNASRVEIAEALTKFETPLERYRFLRDSTKPNFQQMWQWYYVTNLLSAPVTHIRNIVGNTLRTTMDVAAPLADLQVREARTGAAGALVGLKQGWRKAAFAFNEGFSPEDMAGLAERSAEISIAGNRKWPNVISRSLEAGDQFFRTVAAETAASQGAFRRAKAAGVRPGTKAFEAKVAELLTNRPADLIEEMAKAGAEGVFRQKAGYIAEGVSALRERTNAMFADLGAGVAKRSEPWLGPTGAKVAGFLSSVPLGTFLVPFISTPANILRAGARFSPAGFLEAGYKALAGQDVTRIRRQAQLGTALLTYPAIMAWEGKLTGSGPSNPADRSLWLAEGKIPNAIKIGDKWVQYNQFVPLSTPLSLIGNAFELYQQTGEPPDVGGIVFKLGNSIFQQSYLQGMLNLAEAFDNPEYKGARFLGRTASGLIPASSLVRNVNQAFIDPTLRDAQGVTENALQGLPGYSQTIPPKVDREGQPIQMDTGARRFLVPFRTTQDKSDDPLFSALRRADMTLAAPSNQIKDAMNEPLLTREQGSRLEQAMGKAQSVALRALVNTPEFQQMSPEDQRKQMARTQDLVRSQVRAVIRTVAELKAAAQKGTATKQQ